MPIIDVTRKKGMESSKLSHLFYDWNKENEGIYTPVGSVLLLDESLRDGLQSSGVRNPSVKDKLKLIQLMCELGIHYVDLGYPSSSKQALHDIIFLAKEIVRNKLNIKISCAARTHPHDIEAVIKVSQEAGVPVELLTFIGASPIRSFIEKWDVEKLSTTTEEAIKLGIQANLPVSFVTEDTIRSRPETLERLFKTAIQAGAQRLILCDTVGHAEPEGVTALVSWTRKLIKSLGTRTELDWHGHNDRGLAVINTLYALRAGCNRLHGTALGIGERAGNVAMEQLLVNLKLKGLIQNDLSMIKKYCELASKAMKVAIPNNYPVVGRDVFSTATGVHAAAILKAQQMNDTDLEDLIYSSVPAKMLARSQQIKIGSMSGKANVIAWLNAREIFPDPELVSEILMHAKTSSEVLKDKDILTLVKKFTSGAK